MSKAGPDAPIVVFHYPASPYARRVLWYLQLRKIPFTQCLQPPILPRPDLSERLGIRYRRIPLLAIGSDVFLDSRLIIAKLEQLFPPSEEHPGLSAPAAEHAAVERLLSRYMTSPDVFLRGAQLIPPEAPMLQDPNFVRDRSDLTGGGPGLSPDALRAARPEAMAAMCDAMRLLETTLLADGRDWVLKTPVPSLADLEAVWVFHWVASMPGALPPKLLSSDGDFPRVGAFIQRFDAAVKAAKQAMGKTSTAKGDEAAKIVLGSGFTVKVPDVDGSDPVVRAETLANGSRVKLWPTDTGGRHKDTGKLVGMDNQEIVIEIEGAAGVVRVHAPRNGFKIRKDTAKSASPRL